MEINRFIKDHKAAWNELEELLQRLNSRKGPQPAQVDRFTQLYKMASSHLAVLQTAHPGDETTVYLNHLVSRAHNTMYQESSRSTLQLKSFLLQQFPAMLGVRRWFVGLALLLFVIGGIAGFASIRLDPLNEYLILPANMAGNVDPSVTDQPRGDLHSPVISTTIMTNNIRVAVLAFVSGITLGIGTVLLLLYNGLLIGALAAVFLQADRSYVFWAYILPHGIIELAAIFIAGGAGLYMGYRLFVPGAYPRRHLLQQTAKESALLMLGTIPLFIIAGLIEGYITPSPLPLELKYMFSAFTLLLLAVYFIYGSTTAARKKEQPVPPHSVPLSFNSR